MRGKAEFAGIIWLEPVLEDILVLSAEKNVKKQAVKKMFNTRHGCPVAINLVVLTMISIK